MRAIQYSQYGKTQDVCKIVKIDKPKPADGEILVRVKSAALNPIDFKAIHGYVKSWFSILPFVPAMDFSGVTEQLGSGISRFKVGDEVYGKTPLQRSGALAEYLVIKESQVISKKPENVTFEEAAGIPLACLTSYQALLKVGIKQGQEVLILGGSGGTGAAAVQIAKAFGTHVTATTSSKNADFVKGLGADVVVDYTKGDYAEQLKGHQFDIIYDTVGGGYPSAAKVSKSGTQYITIAGGPTAPTVPGPQFNYIQTSDSVTDLEEISKWVKEGKVKPTVDKVFSFEQFLDAFELSESGRARGKVIVSI